MANKWKEIPRKFPSTEGTDTRWREKGGAHITPKSDYEPRVCPVCKGRGYITVDHGCPKCYGTGEI